MFSVSCTNIYVDYYVYFLHVPTNQNFEDYVNNKKKNHSSASKSSFRPSQLNQTFFTGWLFAVESFEIASGIFVAGSSVLCQYAIFIRAGWQHCLITVLDGEADEDFSAFCLSINKLKLFKKTTGDNKEEYKGRILRANIFLSDGSNLLYVNICTYIARCNNNLIIIIGIKVFFRNRHFSFSPNFYCTDRRGWME